MSAFAQFSKSVKRLKIAKSSAPSWDSKPAFA
jgi:hypothetical protein